MTHDEKQDIPLERVKTVDAQRPEDWFRKIFWSCPVGFSITRLRDGAIVEFNQEVLRIFGYDAEEVRDKTTLGLAIWDSAEERAQVVQSLLETGSVRDCEYRFRTKNGTIKTMRYAAEAVHFNQEPCAISFFLDVTQQRQLEEQLRQSLKMEAIGQFAGGIAHDFNNVMLVVSGYADLLGESPRLNPEEKDIAEQIVRASERAASLTRSLLAFSRKQELKFSTIDLNAVVLHVQSFLSRVIGETINLETQLHPDPLIIQADGGQLEQILLNLASNARDAMPRGGKLTITTSAVPAAPGEAILSVTDTGTGIDPSIQSRIFEPFFTTKALGHGTGLGLSMVYSIVKQHRGDISVQSEPNRGAAFRVSFPLVARNLDQPQALLAKQPRGGHETILIAEDDEAVREIIKTVLEKYGYSVIQAVNGEEAIRLFREQRDRIQLVILDAMMPKMNGKEAFLAMKAERPDLLGLFFSGYAADLVQDLKALGDKTEFLLKPVRPSQLAQKVRELLER